ncbi:hypothetical protein I5I01_gp60 [Mycobacterium phage MooMoo]|uniref:Helix-turn-helix DNA binding domain protein n=1 Tax=Mycobacterium phage MooMoo TaxID=2108127 RepID=A0A2P1JR96_9CAUD|nr:hypothetical protein I5I01_gp60 [Mycobacterium phage MooMoo]AVO21665.1 hypothetical protein SEA_MOOMOO_60 [Mycobacterium phage MooMoo]
MTDHGESGIDWFAVDCVVNGTAITTLRKEERAMVVRRLFPRVFCEEIGRRMGVVPRTIERIKASLEPADPMKCPVCGQPAWLLLSGTVEAHPDALLQDCPMSGRELAEGDWETTVAVTVTWLARRIRVGDSRGVWAYLMSRTEQVRNELLMAALAGVPEGVDDPFAWLAEADSTDELWGAA